MSAVMHCILLKTASSSTATQPPMSSKIAWAHGNDGISSVAPCLMATAGRGTPTAHCSAGATNSLMRCSGQV
eukprot:CAMPEP_0183413774 /NCGR_PEP_ID=MMETSP0370-20130417/21929_1 /TAXON_ID=268820 /ORGANISM="Peridinium aciculiferum, Strain PAER-2" /LENGTH=71 /DNA_ID=CAMNT_0025597025 /DNA_START=37 /DNA_END=249 /DNA_ORIENTATION=-